MSQQSEKQCFGINKNLRRCQRKGNWKFFCHDHRFQPLIWFSFFIFSALGGTASILSLIGSQDDIRISELKIKSAENYLDDGYRNKAISTLYESLKYNSENLNAIELLSEQLIILEKNNDAKEILISKKHILTDKSKVMLMLLYYNEKKYDKVIKISGSINPSNVESKWIQFYYVLHSKSLAIKKHNSKLRQFIDNSITDINNRISRIGPTPHIDNPYTKVKISSGFQPINVLHLTSSKFSLISIQVGIEDFGDIPKIQHIKASYSNYGFGVSTTGQFVTKPETVMVTVNRIFSDYNKDKSLTWEDIKLTYKWLLSIEMSIKGNNSFNFFNNTPPSSSIFLTINTGANKNDIAKIVNIRENFKEHYNLDDEGNLVID